MTAGGEDGGSPGATPLDYASAGSEPPKRDPLTYYREPPAISTWTPGELAVAGILVGLPLIAVGLFALFAWVMFGGPFR